MKSIIVQPNNFRIISFWYNYNGNNTTSYFFGLRIKMIIYSNYYEKNLLINKDLQIKIHFYI